MWVLIIIVLVCVVWYYTSKSTEVANGQPPKKEEQQKINILEQNRERNIIRRKEISEIFSTDTHFKAFLNKMIEECTTPQKRIDSYRNHCWSCHHNLDSAINKKCPMCGWLICSCGNCSFQCKRKGLISWGDYFLPHREAIFNFIKNNYAYYNDETGKIDLSSQLHDTALLIYICEKAAPKILKLDAKLFDLKGLNIAGNKYK